MPTYGWNGTVDAGFAACARLPRRTLQRAVEKNHDARTTSRASHAAQVTKVKRAPRRSEAGARLSVATHTRAAPRSTTKA
jgi:hypothetical protein